MTLQEVNFWTLIWQYSQPLGYSLKEIKKCRSAAAYTLRFTSPSGAPRLLVVFADEFEQSIQSRRLTTAVAHNLREALR